MGANPGMMGAGDVWPSLLLLLMLLLFIGTCDACAFAEENVAVCLVGPKPEKPLGDTESCEVNPDVIPPGAEPEEAFREDLPKCVPVVGKSDEVCGAREEGVAK